MQKATFVFLFCTIKVNKQESSNGLYPKEERD
jgi:hypothetical protein